jgi:heptosyltransferase-1
MPPIAPPNRILIIRPSALGDVARSVPLLGNLRRAFPNAAIDWLVQEGFEDVLRPHPLVSEVLTFPRKEFGRWAKGLKLGALRRYLHSLRDRRYDLVIDAQGLFRSGLLTWATKAPRRVGYSDARELGPLKRIAYTDLVPSDIETHTVERMANLTLPLLREVLGPGAAVDVSAEAMRLYADGAAALWAEGVLPPLANPEAKTIVLAPTSRWPGKQWPDDRFAALAKHLMDKGHRVVLVGGKNEAAQIPACLRVFDATLPTGRNLLGRTSIAQLMAVLARADLVVANDSAALHIAVGFGRPVVALFGPTRSHRVGPYPVAAHRVLQHVTPADSMVHKDEANGRRLMERITLEEVVEACELILGMASGR